MFNKNTRLAQKVRPIVVQPYIVHTKNSQTNVQDKTDNKTRKLLKTKKLHNNFFEDYKDWVLTKLSNMCCSIKRHYYILKRIKETCVYIHTYIYIYNTYIHIYIYIYTYVYVCVSA